MLVDTKRMRRKPSILLVVELTRVIESNPTIVKVDSKTNKANGRMIRGFAIVALTHKTKCPIQKHPISFKKKRKENEVFVCYSWSGSTYII